MLAVERLRQLERQPELPLAVAVEGLGLLKREQVKVLVLGLLKVREQQLGLELEQG